MHKMNTYNFAVTLVKEAGMRLKEVQEGSLVVSHKDAEKRDVITNIDLEINKFLKEKIKKSFPDHGVYSEEGGIDSKEKKDYEWAIDPIDGSANFARNIPHFASCLALLYKGDPIIGVVYNPVTDELYSFEKGRGVFLNDNPIKVSTIIKTNDAQALLRIGRDKELLEWGIETQRSFLRSIKKTSNFGSSALDLCFVAAGRVDVVVYGTFTTKDVAGAVGILREAGGEIYTPAGKLAELSSQRQTIVATSNRELFLDMEPLLHSNLLPPTISI